MATIIKKITHDRVYGKIAANSLKEGESKPTVRLLGSVTAAVERSGAFGAYVLFMGDFEAINIATGDEYRAGQAIIPDRDFEAMVKQKLEQALAKGEVAIAFAVDYSIAFSAKGARGYTFVATPVRKADAHDPLDELRGGLKALPKPSTRK